MRLFGIARNDLAQKAAQMDGAPGVEPLLEFFSRLGQSPQHKNSASRKALDAGDRRSVGRVRPDRLERERTYKTLICVNHGKPVDVRL